MEILHESDTFVISERNTHKNIPMNQFDFINFASSRNLKTLFNFPQSNKQTLGENLEPYKPKKWKTITRTYRPNKYNIRKFWKRLTGWPALVEAAAIESDPIVIEKRRSGFLRGRRRWVRRRSRCSFSGHSQWRPSFSVAKSSVYCVSLSHRVSPA